MMCYNKEGGYVMRVKQIKYVIFALICMCVTPLITHAECDYQRLAELSRLASNVQLSYTYSEENGFQITMTNLTNDLYATNIYGQRIDGGAERVFEAVSGSYNYDIYSNDPNCRGDKLLTKYVSTPSPNRFYQFDECKKYPNFKYCQLWLNTAIDISQFREEFNKYETSLIQKNTNEVSNLNVLDEILLFVKDHSFIFIFGFSIMLLLVVTIIMIRVVKRR